MLREGEIVFDICMGLGYIVIEVLKRGVYVIIIEKDFNVIEIVRINFWSRELFMGGKI